MEKFLNNKILIKKLINLNKTISCMESCTGGMLASEITNVEGASKAFSLGIVTYSNEEKIKYGVNKEIIDEYTVYSNEVSEEMARCISKIANSNFGVGITGQLGMPDSNNESKNINLVYISIFDKDKNRIYNFQVESKGKNRFEKKKFIVSYVFNQLLANI